MICTSNSYAEVIADERFGLEVHRRHVPVVLEPAGVLVLQPQGKNEHGVKSFPFRAFQTYNGIIMVKKLKQVIYLREFL